MTLAKVLKRPIITEKSTLLGEQGRYVFEVDSDATKHDIAKAVEWAFDVKVVKVNTLTVSGKVKRYGRRPSKQADWKKAIVSLQTGDTIQLFEGA
ncbi:MAG TPA: 50S ribosomal protein L23 [Dehalococcoidia bacterium]|jgi:large subunit ribosomal protein L23|nr:50S ribosomal protein L23 [Chloroflexota bacterium]MDP6056282.1 50S ribosomal protein L23 [Dehalococcoidia bacterium]MDP7261039.1 50S ribosomal protein L23 [Dehalococcoidia bacterium]MDP7485122.1 50S ribosomal protein L23 [Dehalococcoidia bacterium]HJP27613.1 50S ribosomal protein L23 [Dehalococcoidia bacterium]|tara:strand:+ start:9509 stop:9793 length:285 start_codon:yes stop_codon:yes gene_type:complete